MTDVLCASVMLFPVAKACTQGRTKWRNPRLALNGIVWFIKTVTHLLLYTVANVSPFFWIRLYFIRSWRKISEPKHRTVDHISEPKHRTVDHGGFLKQITKIDSFYNQSFFIFKFSALAEKNMICNMFCKDEIFTVWHSERYKKANLNSKWA